ncbi:MAG: PQQ-binding-like beta-propeller repeat protein [Planctomycetota bacterium]
MQLSTITRFVAPRWFCFTVGVVSLFGQVGGRLDAAESDWPQWRGAQRDGHAAPQMLAQSWPDGGPPAKWQCDEVGRGYSSVAIADGRLYTMGADESNCFAMCLDSQTGATVWKTNVSRAGGDDDYNAGWGAGPRSTPTVDGDDVFVLTDVGVAAALHRDTGAIIWSIDLVDDFGGKIPKWGYSESLLVDGQRIVMTPGMDNFMIAVDRETGRLVWQSRDVSAVAHYVSIMKGSVGSTAYYVTAAEIGLVAFDVTTGQKLFENPLTGNRIATIPTPLLDGTNVYHTSDYGAGNVLLSLSPNGVGGIEADQVYHLDGKTMMNHHGGVVLIDGVIYGFTKVNGGVWMAQDLDSGDTLWEERLRPNESGSIAYADGRLYCYNDKDGSLILVQPSRESWQPRGKLTLPRQTDLPRDRGAIWAHPVIANQTLFIRDQDLIFAYDIAR